MPKYTKQELKKMAIRIMEGLSSDDIKERTMTRSVLIQTALRSGKSLNKTKKAIPNLTF